MKTYKTNEIISLLLDKSKKNGATDTEVIISKNYGKSLEVRNNVKEKIEEFDTFNIGIRVFKGKKMAGHMGDKVRTILNLEIVKSDLENSLIYLKGSIPGSKNTEVLLRESIKKITKKTLKEKYEAKLKAASAKKGKK